MGQTANKRTFLSENKKSGKINGNIHSSDARIRFFYFNIIIVIGIVFKVPLCNK